MMGKKRILVIACGRTIACSANNDEGATENLTGEQLVNNIPGLSDFSDINTLQFRQLGNSNIALGDVVELFELINSKDYDGYIVTHGTDSIEETAFALDLLYNGLQSIVLTGAMRHSGLPGADGNANILAAAIVACDDCVINQGIMIVLNDTVHAARFAVKTHTSRPDAFISKAGGCLGWVSENKLIMVSKVERFKSIKSYLINKAAFIEKNNIPIIKSFSGDDGSLLKLITKSNEFKAIVIDALGAGHVSQAVANQIEIASQKMIVVIASRTGNGTTFKSTYGNIGSEIDLINKGALMAGWLNAIQARILLQLLLVSDLNSTQIKEDFNNFYAGNR